MPIERAVLAFALVEEERQGRGDRALGGRRHQAGEARTADSRADVLDVVVVEGGRDVHGVSPFLMRR